MKRYCIFLLFFFQSLFLLAQDGVLRRVASNTSNQFLEQYELKVKKNSLYTSLSIGKFATGLSIELEGNQSLEKSYVFFGAEDQQYFKPMEDYEVADSGNTLSNVLISKSPFKYFSFFSSNLEGKVTIKILSAPPLSNEKVKKKSTVQGCDFPESISQEVWRTGLPDPKNSPAPHSVKHIIIHHSAGSNTDTNYTNVVRNIYLFHTQSNGWDDIGYNYVVAQNGTIFEGRDGRGVYEDDNVRGAHFCAKNTNTMGICLLGDYTSTTPTLAAFESLCELIAWKLNKESLTVQDSFLHPASDVNATYLPSIAFHRSGCNTVCPGNEVALLEDSIQQRVQFLMKECSPPSVGFNLNSLETPYKAYLSAEGQLTIISLQPINQLKIYDLVGREIYSANINQKEIVVELKKGINLVRIVIDGKQFSEKFIR